MRVRCSLALLLAACSSSAPTTATTTTTTTSTTTSTTTTTTTTSKSRLVEGTFHAPSLGVDKSYLVYLPAGYDESGRSYPVIYMLHGLGGTETNWERIGHLSETADALSLAAIVVMPDGDAGFYVNSVTAPDYDACLTNGNPFGWVKPREEAAAYCVKSARYEDYMTKDLIAHIDSTYRTVREAKGRAIGGLSMGGYGALVLALRNKQLYSSVASHSGVDSLLYDGPQPYEPGKGKLAADTKRWITEGGVIGKHIVAILGNDISNWRAHDPTTLAATLKNGELAIYLDCGTEDQFELEDGAQYLHEILEKAGVDHTWYLGPGDHTFHFWKERLDDSLSHHVAAFEKAGVY